MPARARTLLMFAGQAEEALALYQRAFPQIEVHTLGHYGPNDLGREGTIRRIHLSLAGHEMIFIDSPVDHDFTFTASTSLFIDCESDDELMHAHATLSEGGEIMMPLDYYPFSRRYGWVRDRYGVSWQLNLR